MEKKTGNEQNPGNTKSKRYGEDVSFENLRSLYYIIMHVGYLCGQNIFYFTMPLQPTKMLAYFLHLHK